MRMPNTVFAIVLGILAVYALFAAGTALRRKAAPPSRGALGWALVAAVAVVQVIFLLRQPYSVAISVVTTVLILLGVWLGRTAPPAAAP